MYAHLLHRARLESVGLAGLFGRGSCLQNAKNVLNVLTRVTHQPSMHESFSSRAVAATKQGCSSNHPACARMLAMHASAHSSSRPAAESHPPVREGATRACESQLSIAMHTQHVVLGIMAPVHAPDAPLGQDALEGVAVVAHAYAHGSVDCSPEVRPAAR